eukprot:1160046-Pelagomonas_calceolata.AAC.4
MSWEVDVAVVVDVFVNAQCSLVACCYIVMLLASNCHASGCSLVACYNIMVACNRHASGESFTDADVMPH